MCKMDRNEKCVVIKYLNLKGLSAAEISGELNSVLGDDALSDATIYQWIAEFQRGRKSTKDEHCSGRPVDVCTDENVRHVIDMITTDRRLTVRYVVRVWSYHTVQAIMLLPTHWVTTRCVLDGCRECWRRRKSKSVWLLHVTISVCTTQIQRSFFADMSPWTRLGLITSIPRPSSRASSGSMSLRRRQ